jgi:hypothetical protein
VLYKIDCHNLTVSRLVHNWTVVGARARNTLFFAFSTSQPVVCSLTKWTFRYSLLIYFRFLCEIVDVHHISCFIQAHTTTFGGKTISHIFRSFKQILSSLKSSLDKDATIFMRLMPNEKSFVYISNEWFFFFLQTVIKKVFTHKKSRHTFIITFWKFVGFMFVLCH